MWTGTLIGFLAGLVVATLAAYVAGRLVVTRKAREAGEKEARTNQEEIEQLAKELEEVSDKRRSAESKVRSLEKELRRARQETDKREERLKKNEEILAKKGDALAARESRVARRERDVAVRERELEHKRKEAEKTLEQARATLEKVAGMTEEEARKEIMERVIEDARIAAARFIKQTEEQAQEEAERRAKRIVGIAIARYAGEYTAERTVSVVDLPNDEMKGRIIGREGRNIRAFEAATGVDVIIDDSPGSVTLSAFDPVRREVARIAMERLVADGRIHPARIEEVVEKVGREIDQKIREAGEDALFQLGLGSMHPELVKVLGKMKYRTSYGQNVLQHSIEVARISGLLAGEMGLKVREARRAGLLHDIGKVLDQEHEGPHALVGASFARRYGESAEVVHAIAAHHEEEKPLTLLAHIVSAADAISGARPGARRESLEHYVKRLQDLEDISNSFEGVARSFAIQAGREIRVIVENGKVGDDQLQMLARDIAKKIEEKLSYPGQIKVCVIRETRATALAK